MPRAQLSHRGRQLFCLWNHEALETGLERQGQVVIEPSGVAGIESHPDRSRWVDPTFYGRACRSLAVRRHSVLQIDDDLVGLTRPGLVEALGTITRDEEIAASG